MPEGWRDWNAARDAYRARWCAAEDLSPALCGPAPFSDAAPHPGRDALREAWCARTHIPPADCATHFKSRDAAFTKTWREVERPGQRASLTPLDLAGRDFRDGYLSNVYLPGANLGGARMEGADLSGARMEGADLFGARLFTLSVSSTDLSGVDFTSAALRSVVLVESVNLTFEQIVNAFWDGSVKTPAPPEGVTLEPWRTTALTDAAYLTRWKGWLIESGLFKEWLFPELADVTPTSPDTPLAPSEILRHVE